GNAGGAHHDRERGSVVPAEAGPRLEQELVDRVLAERGRRQRVAERLLPKQTQRLGDDAVGVEAPLEPAADEVERARVRALRQPRQLRALAVGQRIEGQVAGVRYDA